LKILISTFTFHPEGNGVAEVAAVQAFGLARQGHEVTVVCAPIQERKPADYPPNLKIVEYRFSREGEFTFSGQVKEYQDFIATFPCDAMLIHCWQAWPLDAAFPVLERNPAKKILVSHGYTAHLWEPRASFPWGLGGWLRWQPYVWSFFRFLSKLDHVVFLSARKDFGRFFDHTLMRLFGDSRWTVIPNGASIRSAPADLPDFRKQFGIAPDALLLLSVANYSRRKNQLAALRAFAKSGLENAVLVFIGSECNEYTRELQKTLAGMQGMAKGQRVLILDHVAKDLIFAAYRSADLFVLSAEAETQPLVLLDAMACGLPFISTDTGCIAELPGGIVVSSEKEMTAAMHKLAEDPQGRKELGRQGAEAVDSTYNWDRVLARYETLLETLVSAQPTSTRPR